tara:strand:- start:179 stop:409 length:231 start_codon:yes stop_codon:yes gene_type:complete
MRNGADLDSLDSRVESNLKRKAVGFNSTGFNCWHCGAELIWGGDHDLDDYTQDYDIVSNFQCMNCKTFVEVYHKCQ